jgi:hypothetical protein
VSEYLQTLNKDARHFFLFIEGPRSRCYRGTAALRLIVQPCDEDDEVFSAFPFEWSTGGMKLAGENRSTRGKICPSATLSTKNPTWTDPGPRPGLRGERPATNRLTHGTASYARYLLPVSVPLVASCRDACHSRETLPTTKARVYLRPH